MRTNTIKIKAIIGSPKKSGETIRQVSIYEEMLSAYPDVDFEYIYLKEYTIEECRGCGLCFHKGESFCPLQDDRDFILDKMHQADGLILVSQVYSLHITSTLKKVIDRLSFLFHRSFMHETKGFIIAPKGTLFPDIPSYLKKILIGWQLDYVGTSTWTILEYLPEKVRIKRMRQIKKEMHRFYTEIKNKKRRSPGIMQIVSFNVWKHRASLKSENDADYRYFKDNGLFTKAYYRDAPINPVKKLLAAIVFRMALRYMKKNFGDLSRAI